MTRTTSLSLCATLLLAITGCCTAGKNVHQPVAVTNPDTWLEGATAIDLDLDDLERDRDVPLRIYLPDERTGPFPVVFISHGIGESRESYDWLGRAIAKNGYAVIHPTHRGTDRSVLDQGWIAMYKATQNRANWRNRVLDMSYVLDSIPQIRTMDPRLADAFDSSRVAVVGHSAGAWTAAAIAGLDLASGESLLDPRIDAIAPLSMPRTGSIDGPEAWASLRLPTLHMTGTCDTQLIWRTLPRHRRIPWEYGDAADQYLLTLEGGRHTTFSEVWNPADGTRSAMQILIARSVIAFLDAYVSEDETQLKDLRQGGFREIGGGRMLVEQRPTPEPEQP